MGVPVSPSGNQQVFAYDAYGNQIEGSGLTVASAALTIYRHSGEQFDTLTGNYYNRARFYNPLTGGFNRLDPYFGKLQDPQSFHKYLFGHGDPVNNIDPTGLFTQAFGFLAEAAITLDHRIAFPSPPFNIIYGQWARLPGALRAKPDILNFTDKEYNEIKPLRTCFEIA